MTTVLTEYYRALTDAEKKEIEGEELIVKGLNGLKAGEKLDMTIDVAVLVEYQKDENSRKYNTMYIKTKEAQPVWYRTGSKVILDGVPKLGFRNNVTIRKQVSKTSGHAYLAIYANK